MLEWVAVSFTRGIFPIQASNSGLLHCRRFLYCLSHQGSLLGGKCKLVSLRHPEIGRGLARWQFCSASRAWKQTIAKKSLQHSLSKLDKVCEDRSIRSLGSHSSGSHSGSSTLGNMRKGTFLSNSFLHPSFAGKVTGLVCGSLKGRKNKEALLEHNQNGKNHQDWPLYFSLLIGRWESSLKWDHWEVVNKK